MIIQLQTYSGEQTNQKDDSLSQTTSVVCSHSKGIAKRSASSDFEILLLVNNYYFTPFLYS